MPVRLSKPSLARIHQDLRAQRAQNPDAKIDAQTLNKILASVGDSFWTSSDSLEVKLKDPKLLPEEKLALVKKGLDFHEKGDIQALLGDAEFLSMLDPVSANFLKALVGMEPLRAMDSVGGSQRVSGVQGGAPTPEQVAVKKFRELMKTGQLKTYYAAAIGTGDAALKDEALKLFESLPKLNADASADDFVNAGLWTMKPRNIEAMQNSARYLPGRQVLIPTTINADTGAGTNFLAYKEGGMQGITYRATLAGEQGDNYLVKVDGRDKLLEVPKAEVHKLNQPNQFSGDKILLAKTADYSSPFMKAKVAEAAIQMDELVQKLDFAKLQTEAAGGAIGTYFRSNGGEKMSAVQRKCVSIIHDVIDMKYPSGNVYNEAGRFSGTDAGRLAVKGIGSCYMQGSVMAGLLAPFSEALGVDVQFISGGVYRNTNASAPPENQFRSYANQAHGWLQLTYRPSMELRICDRTWTQPDHPADRAYSRWGDRYPTTRYSGLTVEPMKSTDVNMSGNITVATADRQFGVQGADGRDNHMSNHQ